MKDTVDSKKIVGKFVGKYIALAIIIGGISFALENVIPQFVDWDFTATFILYQSVLFIISTLLAITLAVNTSIKKEKISTKEEAKKIAKPIKTILIMVALGVMVVNLVYCYQIEQSGYKDAEAKYNKIEGVIEEYKNEQLENEKTTIHTISNIYVATKEIVTILTYAYAVIYVERMVELSVTNKEEKEE